MNIYFNCGGRSTISGGYGEFARGLIISLCSIDDVTIFIRDDLLRVITPNQKYNSIVDSGAILPLSRGKQEIDIECVICSLSSIPDVDKLCGFGKKVLITGSPFLGIRSEIYEKISRYHSVFYSGLVDALNFKSFLSFNLPQPIEFERFSSRQSSRVDSSDQGFIRFLFVGTFNYWKGVDIAIKAYANSQFSRNTQLYLKCGISKREGLSGEQIVNFVKHQELYFSCVVKYINETGLAADYDILEGGCLKIKLFEPRVDQQSIKEIILDVCYSDSEQIKEIYKHSHALLCTSRGETWSMPVIESLYNGASVIVGEHIGCTEYIKDFRNAVFIVKSQKLFFDSYDFSDRASGGGRAYKGGDICYFECLQEEIISCMENIVNSRKFDSNRNLENLIANKFSSASIAREYYQALNSVLQSSSTK